MLDRHGKRSTHSLHDAKSSNTHESCMGDSYVARTHHRRRPHGRLLGERDVILPEERNQTKDTAFYMSVQLTKLKVCAHAARNCNTDLISWLDFGLFKISQNKGRFWLTLKSLANASGLRRILSPGGYDSHPIDPLNLIRWKTLGGVLLGPKHEFPLAYERQKHLVEIHLPKLAWEVNYWALLTEEGLFDLYPADHDDSILSNLKSRLRI